MERPRRRLEGWSLLGVLSALSVAGLAAVWVLGAGAEEGVRGLIRASARISVTLLHGVGAHYVWALFTFANARPIPAGPEYAFVTLVLAAALGLRLAAARGARGVPGRVPA